MGPEACVHVAYVSVLPIAGQNAVNEQYNIVIHKEALYQVYKLTLPCTFGIYLFKSRQTDRGPLL